MEGLDIPLIPAGDPEEGNFSIFLPGLDSDELQEAGYEYNEAENLLEILCVYGETEDGEMIADKYPVNVSDVPESFLTNLNQVQVLSIDDWEPEELAEDEEFLEELRNLFDYIRDLEDRLEQESPTN